ncbi:MAG: glycosyltransferase family 2 protein [Bacteroidaceae bacterium]|nr:glycosyltransferase family 2 protein [Bacteroidaceae bacterium]
MEQKLLSIILPVYNAEDFIARSICSIYDKAPSESLFEVLAINDGSTDRTSKMLDAYQSQHDNLIVIKKENGGVSSARNVGIEAATGKYVLFLDADDELVENALSKICEYLSRQEPMDMLVTLQYRNNGKREWQVSPPPLVEHHRYSGIDAYKKHFIRLNAGGGICRTEFLRKFNLRFPEGIANSEDTIFFGHLQVYAQSIVYYALPLYRIIQIEGSASRSDNTKVGLSLVKTMQAVADIKNNLNVSCELLAIFDYVVYQLLSNTIRYFVQSKDLSYRLFREQIDISKLLPVDTHHMYLRRGQARIMNLSFPFFYFLCWCKYRN